MKYLILLACCFLSIHALDAQKKKLVILGSSTSACSGPSVPDSCYVVRLKSYFRNLGTLDTIVNLAVGGSTVFAGMPSSFIPPCLNSTAPSPDPDHNVTAALANNPDVILVNYPSNGYDVYSVSDIMCDLRTIKEYANHSGKACFITTTQPRSSGPSFSTSETRRKMAEIKDSVLREFGLFAINFWDGIVNPDDTTILPMYNSGDGIHLNDAGHAILAQRVEEKNIFAASGPLPVSYLSFTGFTKKHETHLAWRTAFDEGVKHYVVQRSSDGVHFLDIYSLRSNSAAFESSYTFTDQKVEGIINYYRLAAINENGQTQFSKIIKVVNDDKGFVLQRIFYDRQILFAEIQSNERQMVQLEIINNMGQVLSSISRSISAGITATPLNAPTTRTGLLFLRVHNSRSGPQVKSFVMNQRP